LNKSQPQISFQYTFEDQINKTKMPDTHSINAQGRVNRLLPEGDGEKEGINEEEDDKVLAYTIKQARLLSEVYRIMMVVSAFLVCLSHGSNDVGNAISPLVVILKH
jgi:phosphate/sulfate permease